MVTASAATIAVPPFDPRDVPAADREWLRNLTDHVTGLAYRSVCDMVRIGQRLAEARARLKPRTFTAWVAAKLPWSRQHAYRLMQVAEAFAAHVSHAETERIDPTALYMLAQAGVPPEARRYACERAEDGERVTAQDAREILAAYRPLPAPAAADVREYERDTKAIDRRDESGPPPPSPAEQAWASLVALAATTTVIHVSTIPDDSDDDEPLYSVTAHVPGGPPRTFVRRLLMDAIRSAAGREEMKACAGCKAQKPASLFSDNATLGGRNRRCKDCERARQAKRRDRERARKRAAAPVA